jgi:group I intron endonuclease
MFLVYCHKNKINGKRYIGFTSYVHNPNRRWRDGLGYLNSHHKVFAAAIEKYGWENFEHEILECNIATREEVNTREKYWIAKYHTYVGDPECWGYNATVGGCGSKGRIVSEAEKEWRRQLKLGTKRSHEALQKQSKTLKGRPQNMTPKKIAQLKACGELLSAAARKKRRPVMCIETGERWDSLTEAALAIGVAETTIGACLHGRQKTVKGLHIKYENEVKET